MNLLTIMTAATENTEGATEVIEESTNFLQEVADWLNGNPVVVACILFAVGLAVGIGCYLAKNKKKGRK